MGVAALIITPCNSLVKFLFPIPTILGSAALEFLSFKRRNAFTSGHNNDSIELEVDTTTWPLCAPKATESAGKEGTYYTDCGK